jgi:hypothetical protein
LKGAWISPADIPNAYRKWLASPEAALQEPFRTFVGVILADTAGFTAARGLLAEGTGDFGEDATALLESGEWKETNDNRFSRPRATCSDDREEYEGRYNELERYIASCS